MRNFKLFICDILVNYKAALTPYVDATNVNLVLPLFGVNVTGIDAVAAVGTSVYEAGNRGERHVVNEPVVECQDWNTFTYETDDVALVNTVNGTQVFGGAKFFKFGRSNPSQPLLIKQLIFTNNWQTIVPGAVWFL